MNLCSVPDRKFSTDPNISYDHCHSLLNEYMPDHVTNNKVLQHLFIKYVAMQRLDNLVYIFVNIKHTGIWKGDANLWKIFLDFVSTQVIMILKCLNIMLAYSIGAGVYFDPKRVRAHELKRMIDNKVIVKTKESCYSNTAKLGELLMETMLEEVDEFCKIDIKHNWAAHAHQQVITIIIVI